MCLSSFNTMNDFNLTISGVFSAWGCRLHPRQKEVKIPTGQNLTPPSAHKYKRWCWHLQSTPTTGASPPPSPSPSTSTQTQRCAPATLITFIQFPLIKKLPRVRILVGSCIIGSPVSGSEYGSGYRCLKLRSNFGKNPNHKWTFNIYRLFFSRDKLETVTVQAALRANSELSVS